MEPVTVHIEIGRLREIAEMLAECGQDLCAEVDFRYPEFSRANPSERRRWIRDREIGVKCVDASNALVHDFFPPEEAAK